MSNLALNTLSNDPQLRALVEQQRVAAKRDQAAAELRAGPSSEAILEQAAAEISIPISSAQPPWPTRTASGSRRRSRTEQRPATAMSWDG